MENQKRSSRWFICPSNKEILLDLDGFTYIHRGSDSYKNCLYFYNKYREGYQSITYSTSEQLEKELELIRKELTSG